MTQNTLYLYQKNHKLCELIVIKAHKDVKHRGLRETLNQIRKEFWITQLFLEKL